MESTPAELGPVGFLKRPCDPESYRLSLIAAQAEPPALVLHDESLPDGFCAVPGPGREKTVTLHVPKTALPLRPPALKPLLGRRLPADSGVGAVLAHYLSSVASALEKGEVGKLEGERLGKVALDLTVMTLAAWAGDGDAVAPETRRQALLSEIETFIEHNLADPGLTPSTIAGHHHISLGHLHRLFQARELTTAAWIRHRRLENCRADLADPRLRSWPVHAIGVRWGFRSAAEFSRAFRAAYGSAPGQYRRQALTGQYRRPTYQDGVLV